MNVVSKFLSVITICFASNAMMDFIHLPIISTNSAFAMGGADAGGGNVVFCQKGPSAQALDLYEANLRGLKVDLGGSDLTVPQKVELALSRLAAVDSVRAKNYRDEFKQFWKNSALLPNIELVSSEDSHHTVIPSGCVVKQAARQATPAFPEDKYFTISMDLWNLMDSDSQAALILHEIVYKEMIHQKVKPQHDSVSARYMVGKLVSGISFETDLDKFHTYRDLFNLDWMTVDGMKVPMTLLREEPEENCFGFCFGSNFNAIGAIKYLYMPNNAKVLVSGDSIYSPELNEDNHSLAIKYLGNGERRIELIPGSSLRLKIKGKTFVVLDPDNSRRRNTGPALVISLYKNGNVKELHGFIAGKQIELVTKKQTVRGKVEEKYFTKVYNFQFSEDGDVISKKELGWVEVSK